MRVLLLMDPLIKVPPDQYGGIERVVADLGNGLARRGHEITLWAAPGSHVAGRVEPFGRVGEWTRWSNVRNTVTLAGRFLRTVGRFDVIHSIDDTPLMTKVDEAAQAAGRTIDLLVQVDLAGEATKHGAREDQLVSIFDAGRALKAARLVGLMLLPPAVDEPDRARPFFTELTRVRDRLLARGVESSMLQELSMGMSHDFEVAVEEGSTMVRVGTAIFGGRSYVRP